SLIWRYSYCLEFQGATSETAPSINLTEEITPLHALIEHISDLTPLMESSDFTINPALLWGGLGLLAGGIAGAVAGGGKGGGNDDGGTIHDTVVVTHHISITSNADHGVINASHSQDALVLSGTSDLVEGTPVAVMLNGKTYHCVAEKDGAWHVTVPPADVASLTDNVYPVTVAGSDPVTGEVIAENATSVEVILPYRSSPLTPSAITSLMHKKLIRTRS
ncbi:hypothetical protein, partial [Atlantibacter subterraneus]|uniref:hypothetical protein n=1 Tax=Atlantibacter subterraneus TaxID=255519 RepID=UPI0028A9A973